MDERDPAPQQKAQRAAEQGYSGFQPNLSAVGDLELRPIDEQPEVLLLPPPIKEKQANQDQNEKDGKVFFGEKGESKKTPGNGRKLGFECLVKIGKIRQYEIDQDPQENKRENNQDGRIGQGGTDSGSGMRNG